MKINKAMSIVMVVQAMVIIGLWYGPSAQPARAEIPDTGAQQAQVIQLLTDNNAKLDKIIELMQSGKLQFQVAKPDDK